MVLPTEERVAALLKGTSHRPAEVIGIMARGCGRRPSRRWPSMPRWRAARRSRCLWPWRWQRCCVGRRLPKSSARGSPRSLQIGVSPPAARRRLPEGRQHRPAGAADVDPPGRNTGGHLRGEKAVGDTPGPDQGRRRHGVAPG